jgi:hypothetical protein
VTWSFRASPFPRMVKGAGVGLLLLVVARTFVGPYQWLAGGLLAAWAVWLLGFIPAVRLRIGRHQCVLSREALLLWLIPIRLPGRSMAVNDFEVWRMTYTAGIALGKAGR